ncbi:Photosystem II PsbQ [Macleaya cordata]|uniref:Photosystem II PsbQ n=1 Tax=Macleaya cordata TaxID=56857 RepID=A0A200QMD4_MACCD|nr:Photosystem II PsbQ [Macleaya cordata]
MAQAMASMTGLRGTSQAVLEGSLQLSGSTRLSGSSNSRVTVVSRSGFTVRALQMSSSDNETVAQSSRRAVLGLVATGLVTGSFVQAVLAEARSIKVGPPPPPSGGLPGTLNSDEARDLELPLKNRFFLQPLPPTEAAQRAKESAKEILNVKTLIDKKAWPYVQNDLRLRGSYLRFDLNTVISSKPKEEKKPLKELTGKLFQTLDSLDYAAKIKSTPEAEKYYAETVSTLNDVLAKIG